jgi:hypothetical protein
MFEMKLASKTFPNHDEDRSPTDQNEDIPRHFGCPLTRIKIFLVILGLDDSYRRFQNHVLPGVWVRALLPLAY